MKKDFNISAFLIKKTLTKYLGTDKYAEEKASMHRRE